MGTRRKSLDIGNPSPNEGESSNLDHEETNRSLEETQQCNPRAVEDAPDIFLSHSGCQKPFVEFLYKALQGANYTVFFDQDVLPKGQPFPDNIKQAAAGCKVGVVVLSEEFLTSLWPMVELEILVSRRVPSPYVLPLFYQLKPEDLKSEEKLEKWRDVWKKLARNENDAKQWEQAVQRFRRFNGDVYPQSTSIYDYIDKVVRHISTLIPCHVPYDCSSIQGQSRLVQEIETKFERLDASRARFVGLHGVGGLGKTTLCKVMVNYYNRHYLGRSFLIEFPSHGGDKSRITSECKKALRAHINASEVHLLEKADSFDQVVQLMRDCVGRQDVFLAIDNLWESCLDEAKRVLQAGFNAKSKILVTSRSEGLLKALLMATYQRPASNASIAPLPAPEHEEAFQIFQESFELRDLRVLVDINEMNNVLKKCRFNGRYHALALKVLANYAKMVCMMDLEKVEHHLSSVLKKISYENLEEVEDVIRLSYDHLPEQKKHLFLDIVVCFHGHKPYGMVFADTEEWISFLYWKFPEFKINKMVAELSLHGLIQIEADFLGRKVIGFHDLYSELAWREIGSSPRYLLQDGIKKSVLEKVEWEELETVIIHDDKALLEKLQHSKCPKLKGLIVENTILKGRGVRLADSMPSLTVLELGSRGEGLFDPPSILNLSGLVELRMLKVENYGSVGIAGLSTLVQLRVLHIERCWKLQKLLDLSSLICLERLHLTDVCAMEVGGLSCTLKDVSVRECGALKRMPDMSSLTCLERLDLFLNVALEEVGGLSCTLKDVSVNACMALKRMPDMSSLTCLERLNLKVNVALEEVGGLSCTLKDVSVRGCGALKRMPDMSSLTCLERLNLDLNVALEEVGGLSCTLKDVSISGCSALKRMLDMSSLTCLERLNLYGIAALEEVGGLSCTLKDVSISGCSVLKRMPDMSNLTCLERLDLYGITALEEVGGLSCTLKVVSVGGCSALKRMPDLSSLTGLERLQLYDNAALEEVEGECLSSNLKHLGIWKCGMLRSCPSVNERMHLERLEMGWADCLRVLQKIPNLQISLRECCIRDDSSVKEIDVGCFSNLKSVGMWNCEALEKLRIEECPRLKKVSVGGPRLKALMVESCEALEEIRADLEALPSFEVLWLSDCHNLKELGAVSSIRLQSLTLRNCPSLEESSIPEVKFRYGCDLFFPEME